MSLPQFLDIETSSPDDGQYPVVVAWSLADGTLKSVIVAPDDEWEPWDNAEPELDVDFLFEQGVSGLDIIRELNQDLSGQTVFIDGLDDDPALIEKLFEAFGDEADFELAALSQLYNLPTEDVLQHMRSLSEERELNLRDAEENVKCMVFLTQELPY